MQSLRSRCSLQSMTVLLVTWPVASFAQDRLPLTPTSARRLLQEQASVNAEFSRLVSSSGNKSSTTDLAELADTESPHWQLYYRDRHILFAIPTRRNVTPLEKTLGEEEARDLAVVLLQQRFSNLLDLGDTADLDPQSVRVVFIEPAARELPLTTGPIGSWGQPMPLSAMRYWPAVPSPYGMCTCQ